MKTKAEYFLNKALGGDFQKSLDTALSKSEIYHQNSRSVSDVSDMFHALKIVPRTILSLLVRELSPMAINEQKEFELPVMGGGKITVTKVDKSAYSGEIVSDNVKVNDFIARTIPSLGLLIMSAFELYDVNELDKPHQAEEDVESKVQKLIDERMRLHSLVDQVVNGKMLHQNAVHQLILDKLSELHLEHKKTNETIEKDKKIKADIAEVRKISESSTGPNPLEYHRGMTNGLEVANSIANDKEPEFIEPPKKKSRPLSDFVENRKKKLGKKEHFIQLEKSETVSCSDCGQTIFSEGAYSGCICYGDSDKKVYIKKSEDGFKIRFGKGWDIDNTEMLLEVLRSKKNGQ